MSDHTTPIDMVLHCPACGLQHIDGPEVEGPGLFNDRLAAAIQGRWADPPHRSHLCHGCGHVWRPADVPTNGVAAVQTKGTADSPVVQPQRSAAMFVARLQNMQTNGDKWLTIESVLALLNDCDMLSAPSAQHDLFTDADVGRPAEICDRNGQVALAMCKQCGKAEVELSGACAPAKRCPYCDDTGDVHTPTGEWRGTCSCADGKAQQQAAAKHAALMRAVEYLLDDGHMNQEHLARLRAAWEGALS